MTYTTSTTNTATTMNDTTSTTKTTKKDDKLTVKVNSELKEQFKKKAVANGTNPTELINQLMWDYVNGTTNTTSTTSTTKDDQTDQTSLEARVNAIEQQIKGINFTDILEAAQIIEQGETTAINQQQLDERLASAIEPIWEALDYVDDQHDQDDQHGQTASKVFTQVNGFHDQYDQHDQTSTTTTNTDPPHDETPATMGNGEGLGEESTTFQGVEGEKQLHNNTIPTVETENESAMNNTNSTDTALTESPTTEGTEESAIAQTLPDTLSYPKLAEAYGVSRNTLANWVKGSTIPRGKTKDGRHKKAVWDEIEANWKLGEDGKWHKRCKK